MRVSRAVLLLLALLGVAQLVHFYPVLPETVASHFDGAGRPNGFQSRDGFVLLSASILAMTVLICGGIGLVLGRIPSKWINLPNREHWLAPERREETIASISGQLEWFGAASLGLYLFILQAVIQTNFTSKPSLDTASTFTALGMFLAYTAVWTVRFVRRFRR
jgi:uncharacterized membrane protein